MVINVITTPVKTSDGDDSDVVWDSVPGQPEQQSDSEIKILARPPVMNDVNNAPDVIKDVAMVQDQSEIQLDVVWKNSLPSRTVRVGMIACETGPPITQT